MVSELCRANTIILSFQAFILEADKMVSFTVPASQLNLFQTDFLASIMVALYFGVVHFINWHTAQPLIDLDVTRAVGYLSVFFVFLRLLDVYFC